MFKSLCGVVLNPCRWTKYLCHDKFYKADSRWFCGLCHITARQYGEVVLPDASTGQNPGTLARKLSRCKERLRQSLRQSCGSQRRLRLSKKATASEGGYGALFAVFALRSLGEGGPGTSFIEHYACRYKLSRSQKSVTVKEFNYVQMSVYWCKNHYKFVLGVGAKAKSVTTVSAEALA